MNAVEQIKILQNIGGNLPFRQKIKLIKKSPIRAFSIEVLQMNVGLKCNLTCRHCHVQANPRREELMNKEVFEVCLEIAHIPEISTIDITGGSPEVNPNLEWFIPEASKLSKRLIVRTNGVILDEEPYKKYINIFSQNRVELATSFPDLQKEKADRQRGRGVFEKLIKTLKTLNGNGYGQEGSGLVLDLIHNPVGAYLPGSQAVLEQEYRKRLMNEFGIKFNDLFCLTNIPIGRYLEFLINSGNYQDYMNDLCRAFNPSTLKSVMCRNTLSVSWDGSLYDCDFNQMLDLKVNHGAPADIKKFNLDLLKNREIVIDNHCYGCVAGSGSSCQGSLQD